MEEFIKRFDELIERIDRLTKETKTDLDKFLDSPKNLEVAKSYAASLEKRRVRFNLIKSSLDTLYVEADNKLETLNKEYPALAYAFSIMYVDKRRTIVIKLVEHLSEVSHEKTMLEAVYLTALVNL